MAKKRVNYRSRFEESTAKILDSLGIQYTFETERIPYTQVHYYIPDFILIKSTGDKLYVETKGYFSPKDRRKTLDVLLARPDLDLRFVFCCATNVLNSGSKTTYADWCDKHGIMWAEQKIPKEWLKECRRKG